MLNNYPGLQWAGNIEKVVDNIINNYPQYDYVVVNDGSKDETEEICIRNHYNLLSLPLNLGIGGQGIAMHLKIIMILLYK